MRREIKQPGRFLDTDLVEDAVVRLARTGLVMGISWVTVVSSSLQLAALTRGAVVRQRCQCAAVLGEPRGVRA